MDAADPYDLTRFVLAQERDYEQALSEIRSGRKQSHWMWYIFPQFEGLGFSATSRHYAIKSTAEAEAYLRHPVLGPRLLECARATVALERRSASEVFGSPDDMKLRSSATLFASVSPSGSIFEQLLDKYFDGERDDKTVELRGIERGDPKSQGDAAVACREPVMKSNRILDLRSVFGVQAQVTKPAAATSGEYVEMECTADPGSGTMVHYHPEQEETFHVLEGTMEVLRDRAWTPVAGGQTHIVPKGEVHAWRNAGNSPVRFQNVHRPALGFQDHMESLDRLATAGKIRGTKDLRSIIYMSMSAVKHRPDVTVKPPQWMVNTIALIGRGLGFTLDT